MLRCTHSSVRRAILVVATACLALTEPAFAFPDGYRVRSWSVGDGLPSASLGELARTPDGYLWIASDRGLVRFDGSRFTTFDRSRIPALQSNVITALAVDGEGTLWAGTKHSGLIRHRDGTFEVLPTGDDFASREVSQIVVDGTDRVWILTQSGVAVARGDTTVAVAGLEHEGGRVAIAADPRDGSLWFTRGDHGEVRRWHDGEVRSFLLGHRVSTDEKWIHFDPDGTTWIASYTGPCTIGPDGTLGTRPLPDPTDDPEPVARLVTRDDRGRLVFNTAERLYREEEDSITRIDAPSVIFDVQFDADGIPWIRAAHALLHGASEPLVCDSAIEDLLLDDAGGVWISTEFSGLLHARPTVFEMLLPGKTIRAVRSSSSGSVWIADWRVGVHELEGRTDPILPYILPLSMLERTAGEIWIATIQGIARVTAEASTPDPDAGRYRLATALETDAEGNVWIASGDGLLRHDGTSVTRFAYDGMEFPAYEVTEIAVGRDGDLWFGTAGGGVVRRRGDVFERLGPDDGLPSGLVRSLCVDSRGVLWIGTLGHGLVRVEVAENAPLSAAEVTAIGRAQGFVHDEVHALVEDLHGRLWIGGARDVSWVSLGRLDALARGEVERIECVTYSDAHGLVDTSVIGEGHPSAWRTDDGRLWFATQNGLAVVDPARLPVQSPPRPVRIEGIRAGSDDLPAITPSITLGSRRRDFEVAYSSPDLDDPGNLRFRYRLVGLQDEWTEAGTRRTAYFTHVPPGDYEFQVAVTRAGRSFGDRLTSLAIVVPPRLHETTWFSTLAAVLALALLVTWLAHRSRTQRARERELRQLVDARTYELVEEKKLVEVQSQQLGELNEAKSRFFANVSHEFRTPLTLTIGPLEDMLAGRSGEVPSGFRGGLELAVRNARRLLDLVNQILDIARLEAGRLTLQVEEGDLTTFVRQLAESFAGWAERRRVSFEVDLPASPRIVAFDPHVVERVVMNLLSNAFKFTPDGGSVRLRLTLEGDAIRLSVADDGPGIPADERELVFSRFYRTTETARYPDTGTGIGLSLVRDLVSLHGGTISVGVSDAGGSEFVVELPADLEGTRSDGDLVPTLRPTLTTPAALRSDVDDGDPRVTVLVVDDNPEIREHVRRHLSGYRVVEAEDGESALERTRAIVPDLVVSDVMMPGLDGFELCHAIKHDPEIDFVPVILLTARGGVDDRVEGLRTGADDYLAKPFSVEELLARIENLVTSRRRLRERFASSNGTTAPRSEDPLVQRFHEVVEEELHDEDLSVQAIADRLRVDRSHLYRRVREVTGHTPTDALRARRLQRAADLLRQSDEGVSEIAYAVGFKSVSHFCQSFRKVYDATPAGYRRAGRS